MSRTDADVPDRVRAALEALGRALTAGDAHAAAALWDVPALVLADQGAQAVATRDEIAAFFEGQIRWHREQGRPRVAPDRVETSRISERLVAVDVIWRGLDAGGVERSRDASHYLMRIGDDGTPRVQVAMSRAP